MKPKSVKKLRGIVTALLGVAISLVTIMQWLPAASAVTPPVTRGTKTYNISAIDIKIPINRWGDNNPVGKMYVLDEDIPAVQAQAARGHPDQAGIGLRDDPIQPLVIRANVGEQVVINFTNRMAAGSAGITIHGLYMDPATSYGANIGQNPNTLVDPGKSATYTWFVPDQANAEGSYVFASMGEPRQQQAMGLFGVLNVEPVGSIYLSPITGLPAKSGWEAMIVDPNGKDFREDTIIYHEFGDETFQVSDEFGRKLPVNDFLGTYRPGSRLLNYRSEPFFRRPRNS